MTGTLIFERESYAILGACFAVYRGMGCGFLEAVYQECLALEFEACGIPFRAQVELPLEYRGRRLSQAYRADFVCFDKIIVEVKATSELVPEHRAQLINYLNATGMQLGLLVNFGHYPKLEHERLANTRRKP